MENQIVDEKMFGVVLTNPETKIMVASKNDAERIREVLKKWKAEVPEISGEKNFQRVATMVMENKGVKINDLIAKTKDYFNRNFPTIPEEVVGNWYVNSYLGFPIN